MSQTRLLSSHSNHSNGAIHHNTTEDAFNGEQGKSGSHGARRHGKKEANSSSLHAGSNGLASQPGGFIPRSRERQTRKLSGSRSPTRSEVQLEEQDSLSRGYESVRDSIYHDDPENVEPNHHEEDDRWRDESPPDDSM